MLSFKSVSIMNAMLGFSLFLGHLFPKPVFYLFQIPVNESAIFNARRTALLYLGVCVLLFLSRNEAHSKSRQAICMSLSVIMLGLASLGIYEFARGFAGVGIWIAIVAEVFLGVNHLRIWFSNRTE